MNWNDIFNYDNGVLYWKIKPCKNLPVGFRAGSINKTGYRYISYGGRKYKVSHVVWLLHNPDELIKTGEQIDHINHNRADDRIENLRKTTNKGNSRNRSLSTSNTSGATGVYWRQDVCKWRATIKVDGVEMNLGFFTYFEAATKARADAEVEYGFHENHGK